MSARVILSLFFILIAWPAWAQTSSPAGLPPASGDISGTGYSVFSVMGEDAAGIISSPDLRGGVGLAASAFAPLLPEMGASFATLEGITAAAIVYPSPFYPASESATIAYRHSRDEEVKVYIIDVAGVVIKEIRTNSATTRDSDGYSRITWSGAEGLTGVYLVQIVADGKIIGRTKVIIIRN